MFTQAYGDNIIKGVCSVFAKDGDLSSGLKANVLRFAYHKAYKVTKTLQELKDKYPDKDFSNIGKACLNTFNSYQATEYNTAVSRCRSAEQFSRFTSDKTNNVLFPNIRWLASRSANPREAHMPFYGRVWAKDDAFWASNQPCALWNCKCDWEQT